MPASRNLLNFSLAVIIVLVTFIIDVTTPRGFAVGVFPHFLAIGITAWSNKRAVPLSITSLATVALLGGLFLTAGGNHIPVFFNRISLAIAFWIMAALVIRKQESDIRLNAINETLEQEVATRTRNLRILADRLKLATQSAGIGIWVWEPDTNRREWDARMYELYGIDQQSVGGTLEHWIGKLHPEDRERVSQEISEAIDTHGEFHAQFRIVWPDGTIKYLESHGRILQGGEAGDVRRMTGVARDITEEIRIESELRQAQKMEAVGQLTGGVAHDFNNLLAVIMGNLEMLGDEIGDDSPAKEMIDTALQSTLRGADLTQRLLAYARKQALQPQPTDINALVMNVAHILRRSVPESIKIRTIGAPSLPQAMIDPHQFENALINLIINSRDAMPDGGTITIRTGQVEQDATDEADVAPGRYVMISVKDTGNGMSPAVLEQAFEPFFTTKEVGEGSGLGLSMIYGLIKQSGGYIEMHSEAGQGTHCVLYLPVALESRTSVAQEVAGNADTTVFPGGNETILVVEDDESLRNFLRKALALLGYRIMEAQDGPTAIEMLDEIDHLDLLFTDMVMPNGMSGSQLAAAVHERFPEARALYSSGYPRAREGSFDPDDGVELLSKPYTRDTLARAVREALDAS